MQSVFCFLLRVILTKFLYIIIVNWGSAKCVYNLIIFGFFKSFFCCIWFLYARLCPHFFGKHTFWRQSSNGQCCTSLSGGRGSQHISHCFVSAQGGLVGVGDEDFFFGGVRRWPIDFWRCLTMQYSNKLLS